MNDRFLTPAQYRAGRDLARRKALRLLAKAEQELLAIVAGNTKAEAAIREHTAKARAVIVGKPTLRVVRPK